MKSWTLWVILAFAVATAGCGKGKDGEKEGAKTKSMPSNQDEMRKPAGQPERVSGSAPQPEPAQPEPAQPEGGPVAADPAAGLNPGPAGPAPAKTRVEPAKIDLGEEPDDCIAECVRSNQMRAVAAEQIDADCKAECAKKKDGKSGGE